MRSPGHSAPRTLPIPASSGYAGPGAGVSAPQSHISRPHKSVFQKLWSCHPLPQPDLFFSSAHRTPPPPLIPSAPQGGSPGIKSPPTLRRLRKFPPTAHVISGAGGGGLSAPIGHAGQAPPLELPAFPPAVAQRRGCLASSRGRRTKPRWPRGDSDSGEGGGKPEGTGMKGWAVRPRGPGLLMLVISLILAERNGASGEAGAEAFREANGGTRPQVQGLGEARGRGRPDSGVGLAGGRALEEGGEIAGVGTCVLYTLTDGRPFADTLV